MKSPMTALVGSVGVHGVGAAGHGGVDGGQLLHDELVLHLADTQQVRALAAVHLCDHRSQLADLAVPQLRCPAPQIVADDALELLTAPRCW